MSAPIKPEPGETWRSGRDRITYDPDWSPSLPWCTFIHGTACRQFASLRDAQYYMDRTWTGCKRWVKTVFKTAEQMEAEYALAHP